MSIEPLKNMTPQKLEPLQRSGARGSAVYEKLFERALAASANDLKSLDNSPAHAAGLAHLAQLQLLQQLFVADEDAGDELLSGLSDVEPLSVLSSRESQIIDRYYADQQPSLREAHTDRDNIDHLIDQVAAKVSLSPELIRSVVTAESAYDPAAVSPAGARGLMQLMPDTARELGVQDSFNPLENLLGGSRYLKQLLDKYDGDLDRALAAYNWGQGNVDRHGLAKMPEETRHYLVKIKGMLAKESA